MDVSSAIPAGEAFVTSFSDMTRLMVGQSKALARKVSLAQLLDDGDHDSDNTINRNNDNRSNGNSGSSRRDNRENSRSSSGNRAATNSGLSEHTDSSNNRGPAVLVGTTKARAKVVQDLRSLDAIVLDLERRAASMRDAIDRQRRGNEVFRELSEATRRQTAQLAAACASLPEHLPHDGPTVTAAVAVASTARSGTDAERREPPCSATATAAAGTAAVCARTTVGAAAEAGHSDGHAFRVAASALPVVPVMELVTIGELEEVPRSTRSRLTIAHINAAVTEIQKAMEKRYIKPHTFVQYESEYRVQIQSSNHVDYAYYIRTRYSLPQ